MAKILKLCKWCGKQFYAEIREINRGNGKFCSFSCSAKYGNSLRRQVIKVPNCSCAFCSREFYRKPSGQRGNLYCSPECFYKATHPLYTEEELIEIIQAFCEQEGRIPLHAEFRRNSDYPDPGTYCVTFGSWNEAIRQAGFVPNQASLGSTIVAKDGHKCRSLAERIIDDWLLDNLIKHEKEVLYPNSRLRADWLAKDFYIEYLGLSTNYDHWLNDSYQETLFRKRAICRKYNLTLIELYPEDLGCLEECLDSLCHITVKRLGRFDNKRRI